MIRGAYRRKVCHALVALMTVGAAGTTAGCADSMDDSQSEQETETEDGPVDGKNDDLPSGKADSFREDGLKQRILYIANTYSFEELDEFLHEFAAQGIVDRRNQAGPYYTLSGLDEAYWVGPHAFEQIIEEADSVSDDELDDEGPKEFRVTLENISGQAGLTSPFAPGAWAVHGSDNPLGTAGEPAGDTGLEQLAEDGGGGPLATHAEGKSGVTDAGAFAPDEGGPLLPGSEASFTVEASPSEGSLSLATMFAQSNDVFVAPGSDGIDLYHGDGYALPKRDATHALRFWDAGTEHNQAPTMGPVQAPRQPEKGVGAAEGVVRTFNDTTRALPSAEGIVDVSVTESEGTYTVTVENVSASAGAMVTPLTPVFHATHGADWQLFSPGDQAGDALETLAEDGSPAGLVEKHSSRDGATVGAAATAVDADAKGPAGPGQAFEFEVDPSDDQSQLSLAAMVVASNDAFIALKGGGVDLLDDEGEPRGADEVTAALERRLAVWDAGTEANQVPGAGSNQPKRQDGKDTGPADSNDEIRVYHDATNDLAGEYAGGFLDVTVEHGASDGEFTVTVENTSNSTAYTGVLTPVAWATTDGSVGFFETGSSASSELESLAEDGKAQPFVESLPESGVGASGVAAQPSDASEPGPLHAGASYEFTVTADESSRYLNFASMVVPSNDTFVALGETGVALLDENGDRRDESAIAEDIASTLEAFDAGTEANQAGAAGPDQPPRQEGPDTGAAEGNGNVRELTDPVWSYPSVDDVLRVTIQPTE